MAVSLRAHEILFGFCGSPQSSDARSSTIVCNCDERTRTSTVPYHRQRTNKDERMAMTFQIARRYLDIQYISASPGLDQRSALSLKMSGRGGRFMFET